MLQNILHYCAGNKKLALLIDTLKFTENHKFPSYKPEVPSTVASMTVSSVKNQLLSNHLEYEVVRKSKNSFINSVSVKGYVCIYIYIYIYIYLQLEDNVLLI